MLGSALGKAVVTALAAVSIAFLGTLAWAKDTSLASFAGTFQGTGMSETADGKTAKINARDFDVTVRPTAHGFDIVWKSIEYRLKPGENSGEEREETQSFVRGGRSGLYRALGTGDPAAGRPLYWARLAGNTLTVEAAVADESGATVLLSWERSVEGKRMRLVFRRSVDGRQVRQVKGVLIKTSD